MCIKTALIFATVVESSPPKQESHRYVLVQLRRKRTELAKFEKESGDERRRSRFDFLLLFPCNLWLCWFLYQGLNGLKIFHCNNSNFHDRVLWILASYWINCICHKMFTSNGYFGLAWYFIAILHTYKLLNWYIFSQTSLHFIEINSLTFELWRHLSVSVNSNQLPIQFFPCNWICNRFSEFCTM